MFTVDQANKTLPLVRKIVEDVVSYHRHWREAILELDLATSTRNDATRATAAQLEEKAQSIARDLESCQRELADLGIQLKDPRLGLIDFPSDIMGRPMLLCWRLGEPEVQFWHEMDAGFSGRQPLSPELVG